MMLRSSRVGLLLTSRAATKTLLLSRQPSKNLLLRALMMLRSSRVGLLLTSRAATIRQQGLLLSIGNHLSLLAGGESSHLCLKSRVAEGGCRDSRWTTTSLQGWSLGRMNHDHSRIHVRR